MASGTLSSLHVWHFLTLENALFERTVIVRRRLAGESDGQR